MKATITDEEFEARLKELCESYGVREFTIYGRFPQSINAKGQLVPSPRLIWLQGEALVADEAQYHFGLIAEGKEP